MKPSIIWYGLPTLNSDMPCFWKAHFALAWTSLLGIFFPDALHLVLHFHRSASRLGMERLQSVKPLILCLQFIFLLKTFKNVNYVYFYKRLVNIYVNSLKFSKFSRVFEYRGQQFLYRIVILKCLLNFV